MPNREAKRYPPNTHGSTDLDVFVAPEGLGVGTDTPVTAFQVDPGATTRVEARVTGQPPAFSLENTSGSNTWEYQVDGFDNLIFRDVTAGANVIVMEGQDAGDEVMRIDSDAQVGIGTGATVGFDLEVSGNVGVTGTGASLTFQETTAEPSDPAEDRAVMWLSDGTGFGDVGDICAKSTVSGTTRKNIIHDHSAGST